MRKELKKLRQERSWRGRRESGGEGEEREGGEGEGGKREKK